MNATMKKAVAWVCVLGEVMYDSLFGKTNAEAKLFGIDFNAPDVPNWVLFPEVPESATSTLVSIKRLTRYEEELAFLRYNYSKLRMAKLEKTKKASTKEYKLWRERAEMMKNYLVTSNLSLVISMAKRTRIEGVEFPELIAEGNLVLLRVVEKFDASLGFKFSTYACRSILAGFNRMASKVARRSSREVLFPCMGFESHLGAETPTTYKGRDRNRENALEALNEVINSNSAGLSKTEEQIIVHRFGLEGETPKTLKEVSGLMRLSEERIRQIQIVAIAKIRESMDAVMN